MRSRRSARMIEYTNPYFRKPKTEFFDWSSLTLKQLDDEIAYLTRLADKYGVFPGVTTTVRSIPSVIFDALSAAHRVRKLKAEAA